MSKINTIQQKIMELSGGEFQKLCDRYLYKKYKFSNICPLGSEDGTNKPTIGIPDSYVKTSDDKYILIMYGSVKNNTYSKLEQDIKSTLNPKKLNLKKDKIEKIICVYSSTNITPEQQETLKNITEGISLEIIDLGTMSHDLQEHYSSVCYEYLNIPIDSYQIFSIDDFVDIYNKKSLSSPLDTAFMFREKEIEKLKESISTTDVTAVIGAPGVGKTKLVLETCKLFNENEYKIYCVKSNGASIQSDLNIYFNEPGNYILFLDDINEIREIEYILGFIHIKKQDTNIKIVATVRDYAKEKILSTLFKYTEPSVIKIEIFSNEQIRQFLQKIYNINNPKYIEQICKISQGNIRLAVMAAQKAINKGYNAIINTKDLFKSYYCDILSGLDSQRDTYCILFIIGFLGSTNYKLNETAQTLLNCFNINESSFIKVCDYLYSLEVIDKYEDEVLKISDQNLKDFIIYYVLIEQKYISLENLLSLTFPKHSMQIVDTLNIILRIFFDEENFNYIKTEINKAWQNCNSDEEYYFVKHFSRLNLDRTLLYIQNRINSIESLPYDIKDYDIYEDYNNKNITSFEIEILSQFKRTEYREDAIELLIDIFNKNANYIHDIYIALSEMYNYDEDSYCDDYINEYFIIDKIWQLSEYGTKTNETLLLISLFKSFFKIEDHITKNGLDKRSFIMQQIYVAPTKNAYKLRKYMWRILHKLYQMKLYKPYVKEFIYNYHLFGANNKYRTKFIQFDMDCFSKLFVSRKKIIDFDLAVLLYNLTKIYDYLSVRPNKALLKYKENAEFMLLINLSTRNKLKEHWKISEEKRKKRLFKQINRFKEQDWVNFINVFKKYEKCSFCTSEHFYSGLMDVLELLEKEPKIYLYVINLYFKKKIQTIYYPSKIIRNLFKFIGTKKTKNLITKCRIDEKYLWLKAFYEEYPEADIDENVCNQLTKDTEKALRCDNPKIISVFSLEKYSNFDSSIIGTISQMICAEMHNNKYIVSNYLKTYFFEEDAENLVNIFDKNIELLEELYLMSLKLNGEHSGCLFVEIFKKDASFWNKITEKLSEDKYENVSYHGIFEYIWKTKNYAELIDIAIDNMILKKRAYYLEFLSAKIFPKLSENGDLIIKNQQKYIFDFIQKNAYNKEKLQVIFDIIVYRYENLKIKYIQHLLKLNSDINIFKAISIEPASYSSWNGSFVPIIEQRIKSLESIKSILKGSKYIQHRCYINDLISSKKEYARQEKIRDYLESLYD